jgi:hypothetical protein
MDAGLGSGPVLTVHLTAVRSSKQDCDQVSFSVCMVSE